MVEKICLDTDVCIALLNGEARVEKFQKRFAGADLFTTSISVFELFLRKNNLEKVYSLLDNLIVLNLDERCAIIASNLYKELKVKGDVVEFRDILIASIAMTNNCILATFNTKHFSRIKNLQLLA